MSSMSQRCTHRGRVLFNNARLIFNKGALLSDKAGLLEKTCFLAVSVCFGCGHASAHLGNGRWQMNVGGIIIVSQITVSQFFRGG